MISPVAIYCDKKRGNVSSGKTPFTKLITDTKITAAATQTETSPKIKAIKTAMGKIMPPPRKVTAV